MPGEIDSAATFGEGLEKSLGGETFLVGGTFPRSNEPPISKIGGVLTLPFAERVFAAPGAAGRIPGPGRGRTGPSRGINKNGKKGD